MMGNLFSVDIKACCSSGDLFFLNDQCEIAVHRSISLLFLFISMREFKEDDERGVEMNLE